MITLLTDEQFVSTTREVTNDIVNGETSNLENLMSQFSDWCVTMSKTIVLALLVLVIGHYLIKFLCKVISRMMKRRNVEPSIQSFINSFVNISLTVLLVITVISILGINTTSFAALLASAGVAIGVALSGNLQNFAGGLIIMLLKPYKIGDYIVAMDNEGYVKSIQMFHTVLVTLGGKLVYLPNGSLSSGSIVNWSGKGIIRVEWIIGIEYGEDTEKARRIMLEVFDKSPLVLKEPAASVNLNNLSASSVDLVVRVWVDIKDYWPAFYGIQEDIYKAFNRQGVSFPFPQIQVHQS